MLDFFYLFSGAACPPNGTPYQWPSPKEMLADALQWSEQYQIATTWSARVRKEIAK